jgi:hypothetical protein
LLEIKAARFGRRLGRAYVARNAVVAVIIVNASNCNGFLMTRKSLIDLAGCFGTDKGAVPGDFGHPHHYTEVYERFLEPLRDRPLRLLEIGVWKGASLRVWEDYFPNATIIGIENLADIVEGKFERATVMIGDATNTAFMDSVVDRFVGGEVDVVIDDGSHILDQQITCLEHLMPRLAEGGLYFIEDIACSRFPKWNRGTLPFHDLLDYVSSVALQATFFDSDPINDYHTIRYLGGTGNTLSLPVASVWNRTLYGVHLFHNIVVIEKRARELPDVVMNGPAAIRPSPGFAYLMASSPAPLQQSAMPHVETPIESYQTMMARANLIESENLKLEGELSTQRKQASEQKEARLRAEADCDRERDARLRAEADCDRERDARLRAESLLTAMYASTSWRVSRPIRGLKRLFLRTFS